MEVDGGWWRYGKFSKISGLFGCSQSTRLRGERPSSGKSLQLEPITICQIPMGIMMAEKWITMVEMVSDGYCKENGQWLRSTVMQLWTRNFHEFSAQNIPKRSQKCQVQVGKHRIWGTKSWGSSGEESRLGMLASKKRRTHDLGLRKRSMMLIDAYRYL